MLINIFCNRLSLCCMCFISKYMPSAQLLIRKRQTEGRKDELKSFNIPINVHNC